MFMFKNKLFIQIESYYIILTYHSLIYTINVYVLIYTNKLFIQRESYYIILAYQIKD